MLLMVQLRNCLAYLKVRHAGISCGLEQINVLVGQAVVVSGDFSVGQNDEALFALQFLSVGWQGINPADKDIALAVAYFVFHGYYGLVVVVGMCQNSLVGFLPVLRPFPASSMA